MDRRTGLAIGSNVVTAAINAGTGLLVVRLLLPEARGALAAIQLWAMTFATLASVGLSTALTYFVSKRVDQIGRRFGTSLLMGAVVSLLFVGVGAFLMPWLLNAQEAGVQQVASAYLWIVPTLVINQLCASVWRGAGSDIAWHTVRISPSAVWLAVVVGFWLTGRASAGGLALTYLVLLVPMALVQLAFVLRASNWHLTVDRATATDMLRYGSPTALAMMPGLMTLRLDQLLMTAFVPADALGLYVAAVAWSGTVQLVLSGYGMVALPRLAGAAPEKKAALVRRVVLRSCFMGTVVGIIVALLTPWAIPTLFGHAYSSTVPVAVVLVLGGVLYGAGYVMDECLRGVGAPAAVLPGHIAGLLITAVGLPALLPLWGIMGAAIASSLAYLGVALVSGAMLRKRLTGFNTASTRW